MSSQNLNSQTYPKTNRYPSVLSQVKIGPVTLPNKIIFPTWALNYANTDGTVSPKLMKYYTDLAKGGCGLVMTGCAVVAWDGVPFKRVMRLDTDDYIAGLKKLFSEIRQHGSVAGLQLVSYGRQSSTSVSGDVLKAPSAIPCPMMSQYDPEYKVKEMTVEEIHQLRDDFIAAAKRAETAGVDLIEIHATHGYMLNEFMSPYSNKRTDHYGGSVENRMRVIVEIIEGIGKEVSDKIALCLRVNGNEFVEGGLTPGDYKEIMPLLENTGLHMLSVSAGVYETVERIVPPKHMGPLPHLDMATQIKAFTNLPVCGVGTILKVETAETIIAEGKADLCAMGRAQHADPFIVLKSAEGREQEIRECRHCNCCTFWTTGDPEVYCGVNPDYKKPKAN